MIIDDLDIVSVATSEFEEETPWPIDRHRPLVLARALQPMEVDRRQRRDLIQRLHPSIPDARWVPHAAENVGRFQVPTLRNVDKRGLMAEVPLYWRHGRRAES